MLQEPSRRLRGDFPIGERVRSVLEGEHPRWGRTFEYLVYALIVVTMIGVILETLPNLPNSWKISLAGLEVAVVAIFTVEYVLRIFAAPEPMPDAPACRWDVVSRIARFRRLSNYESHLT